MHEIVLETVRVTKRYAVTRGFVTTRSHPAITAVDDVSFHIGEGTTLCLVGESGCGKTTLARMAVGLDRPSAGDVLFKGRKITGGTPTPAVRPQINMIFQSPSSSLNPSWRVRDIVAEPLRALGLAPDRAAIDVAVGNLLQQVGLAPADAGRYPHEFSGGQRQRISIARALSNNPAFIACDEPTSALDVSVQAQVLNLMRDLQARLGLTYLFITHDLAVVRHMSDRLAVMYLGRVSEIGPSERIFERPRHPYTRALLNAVADVHRIGRVRVPVPGVPPDPAAPPPGCTFHPRCPLTNARCRSERPAFVEVDTVNIACHAVEEGRDHG